MHRFLPHYPDKELNPKDFLNEISSKKEFNTPFLQDGKLYPHQKFVSRFVSPYTKYDELILFHEMGSGKTQTAINVAETLMTNPNSGIVKTVVVVRGKGLGQNFINELVYNSTDGKYLDEKKKLWKQYYEFWTMEIFGKTLKKLSDKDLLNRYNNILLIIDEAHHLKKKSEGSYNQIHRLLHLLPHRKALLLTGTPMKDDVSEFANCANLLLTLENQLAFGSDFNQEYFLHNKLIGKDFLKEKLTGLVSFYKGEGPDVEKTFNGTITKPMKHIPIVACYMDPFQERHCREAHKIDSRDSVVYINSRQASLFVYPDGSYGRIGFKKYIKVVKKIDLMGRVRIKYVLDPILISGISQDLGKYSTKFKKVIDTVTDYTRPKTFVYTEFVHGSGAILLAEILNLNGYSQATGKETTPGKRYILATNQSITSNIVELIERFNAPDNVNGDIIQIFIGSQIISEGYSLKDVSTEFILTPHWNFSETEQIIARCWRLNSHSKPKQKLTINLLTLKLNEPFGTSEFERYGIDLYMYKTSETKDYKIKQMERLLKEISVDCHNHVPLQHAKENSRDCDYTTCKIDCMGTRVNVDQASYDVLYPPYEELETIFVEIFSTNKSISLERLMSMIKYNEIIVLSYITDLIFGNMPLSINNTNMFLRKTGNRLYVTNDPTVPVDSLMPLIPVRNQKLTAQDLLKELERKWIMNSLKLLFEHSGSPRHILHKLPRKYQHLILTSCLYADATNTGNPIVIKKILDHYRGFYKKGEQIYVWLFHEKFKTTRLDFSESQDIWVPAERDIYQELRDRLYSSPVGYYGLYNPQLDEFCLRKATDTTELDLRRVAVGRRCGDWDQTSLFYILQNKLNITVDVSEHNRASLCEIIKKELFARKLVMYNFDCGNQFKIRGRI
uniref:NTPase I n=1 Tax=Rhinella marina erythrocytic-like virus TaxID=2859906 RepID=A0A8F6UAA9_9VIRU|nr:NTPase I [Rhinella marina erythrocytic-like virus]